LLQVSRSHLEVDVVTDQWLEPAELPVVERDLETHESDDRILVIGVI